MERRIMDLPPMERLAVEQALFSRIGEDVSTKSTGSLRNACDEQVLANYRAMGAKSYDVHVAGEKVGTYSVRVGKESPEKVSKRLVVRDPATLEAYVASDECAEERGEYVRLMARNLAEFLLETYGIVADGCEVVEEVTPAQPPRVLGTTLRVDADKVASALAGSLPAVIAGLIEGGD